jgi:hypothetical protein
MISLFRTLAAFTIGFVWVALSAQAFTVPVPITQQQQVRTSSLFPTRIIFRPRLASSPSSDDEKVDSGKESGSLLTALTDYGQSLKPKAQKASANAYQTDSKGKKVMYTLQTCVYYLAFIIFRGYRGFFVLLPAVFRQVYARLENAMDYELDEDDQIIATSSSSSTKAKWRTKITVSLLAGIVTASYVVGGMLRVFGKFLRTMTQTSSVKGSFEAAADQVEQNETRIRRRIVNINGEDEEAAANSKGLSP